MTAEEARAVVAAQFSSLALASVTGPRSGTSNECFLIDGTWIFRFPKDAEAEWELDCERLLLPRLPADLALEVPRFAFLGEPSPLFRRRFVGYRSIPGAAFRRERLEGLPEAVQREAAARIGAFLGALHSYPVERLREDARQAGLKLRESPVEWFTDGGRDFRRTLNAKLFEYRHHAEFPRFRALFDRLLEDPDVFQAEEAVVHGDLSEKHLLFCEERQAATGVIDFGNLAVGDPFSDFMHLAEMYGRDFCRLALESYGRPGVELVRKKLAKVDLVLANIRDFRRLIGLPESSSSSG
jgi:aminoglycoside 2''-phosphotransferase